MLIGINSSGSCHDTASLKCACPSRAVKNLTRVFRHRSSTSLHFRA
ncbi:hypothetical protein HMPREF1608_05152 [Escherichia coli 908525]|nr:hypothetical protein HMPREF9551_00772 [Escherichia coli MS 196-1]EFU57009.1 hypothetical protein HMPREF9545_03255 [Escherichia coli MS 16-3]EGB74620.1 hypothetical protein HMPREF9532_04962 [Escherichia coli MS 57-2]EHU22577.1 hypothetical protein ECDEC1E_3774 [Escherichia coli DEC1E]EHU26545.1 hypothetical protein ECDEC2A_3548 [Escherichia coli DEC2A]EKI24606.1 hypothetical protein ECARS42123_3506 [Escherichia coli ARS4.2123]ESA94456.1 hypothetical protein HMPREF1601_00049 [Escherichia col